MDDPESRLCVKSDSQADSNLSIDTWYLLSKIFIKITRICKLKLLVYGMSCGIPFLKSILHFMLIAIKFDSLNFVLAKRPSTFKIFKMPQFIIYSKAI